jgi:hypothetical protein
VSHPQFLSLSAGCVAEMPEKCNGPEKFFTLKKFFLACGTIRHTAKADKKALWLF